jgi:catechol 2,3-dioxygenase-like lactoylglutathione lyase family enzyme
VFLGWRSVIYSTDDIARDKALWAKVLGIEPYFDQPFYAGFDVNGYELGLDPSENDLPSPRAYLGVEAIDEAVEALVARGAAQLGDIQDVGGGIRMCLFDVGNGHIFGVIENPHFKAD